MSDKNIAICGIDCNDCDMYGKACRGCAAACGKPFGGECIAAEYCKVGGLEAYKEFKEGIRKEINELLLSVGAPGTPALYELSGSFVNLEYTLPSGEKVKFLDEKRIYLGCQVEQEGTERCFGAVAGMDFILVCSYLAGGAEAELLLFKRR